MRVLIVSDTHHKNELYIQLVEKHCPDYVIHCGDVEGSEVAIESAAGCPVTMVMGNNDFFSHLPREKEIKLGRYRIWVTHGHNYYVSMSETILKQEARCKGVDIVVYGHTHRPIIQKEDDLITINPGSLTYPRQEGRKPSYILMEIEDEKDATFKICYV